MTRLEKTLNIVGRWGLGVPPSTAVEAVRGEMGWSTFRERVIKKEGELFEEDRRI